LTGLRGRPYPARVSRTLVVGFDGATPELCDRWCAEGRMPALRSIRDDGSFAGMRSVFPYNSAVAWTSLSTGANPGNHGIFDFVLPRRDDYLLRVATREDRRVPALWNYAVEAGARVGIVNIPMTFPAEPIHGVMVSGMDAPGLDERAVHPSEYLAEIRRLSPGYRILSNAALAASRGDWDTAERELVDTLLARSRFVTELARVRDMDLLMVNLEATDGAHHFFWQHHDSNHPRHDGALAARFADTIGRVYEVTDRELGRLIDAYAPDTVFVVSDHGGGPSSDWILFVNDWLASEGLLSLAPKRSSSIRRRVYGELRQRLPVSVRRSLRPMLGRAVDRARGTALYGDVDWARSRAYAHMQSAVRVNLAGREPSGSVPSRDLDRVAEEVEASARALGFPTGAPVFAGIMRAAEVYAGASSSPWDVVLEPAPGLHIRSRNTTSKPGFLHRLHDLGIYMPSGLHTPVGMVAAAGAGIERRGRSAECDIHQVAPSVLAVMGVPSPRLDGIPFEFVTSSTMTTAGTVQTRAAAGSELSSDEEAEVLERLRGLGYVD
jgi:predicted AlkP superfamily phosphohydrolase/phosphomutase